MKNDNWKLKCNSPVCFGNVTEHIERDGNRFQCSVCNFYNAPKNKNQLNKKMEVKNE